MFQEACDAAESALDPATRELRQRQRDERAAAEEDENLLDLCEAHLERVINEAMQSEEEFAQKDRDLNQFWDMMRTNCSGTDTPQMCLPDLSLAFAPSSKRVAAAADDARTKRSEIVAAAPALRSGSDVPQKVLTGECEPHFSYEDVTRAGTRCFCYERSLQSDQLLTALVGEFRIKALSNRVAHYSEVRRWLDSYGTVLREQYSDVDNTLVVVVCVAGAICVHAAFEITRRGATTQREDVHLVLRGFVLATAMYHDTTE
jgi:hypothetical protein